MARTTSLKKLKSFPKVVGNRFFWEKAAEGLLGQADEEEPMGKQPCPEDTGEKGLWREGLAFDNHHEWFGGQKEMTKEDFRQFAVCCPAQKLSAAASKTSVTLRFSLLGHQMRILCKWPLLWCGLRPRPAGLILHWLNNHSKQVYFWSKLKESKHAFEILLLSCWVLVIGESNLSPMFCWILVRYFKLASL